MATYQAANILGRVPVFIGSALSIVIFPRMVAGQRHPRTVVRESIRLYLALCVPIAAITATLPAPCSAHLFPARYGDVASILPWAAVAGLAMGVVNLTTTYFQATGLFPAHHVPAGLRGGPLCAASTCSASSSTASSAWRWRWPSAAASVAVTLIREIGRTWPGALCGSVAARLTAGGRVLSRSSCSATTRCLWVAVGAGSADCVSACEACCGSPGGRGAARTGQAPGPPPRLRGSRGAPGPAADRCAPTRSTGGWPAQFDITVVCARYRGAQAAGRGRRPLRALGLAGGDFPERLTYFASLPYALLRYRSDLVVEDFGAPFSSVAVPWMTARPVLGVVQWLFAEEKSDQYHLPFHLGRGSRRPLAPVDDRGLRRPRGACWRRGTRGPRSPWWPTGSMRGAFRPTTCARSGIAYLGRLEIAQKGLDLLLDAYARLAGSIEQDLVLGGDGPDRQALVEQAERLGIADRVRFVGRVPADERFGWLAGADLVAMPSRYETFGMVAAEALAVRTPVVAFDIPCLRSLVDDGWVARARPSTWRRSPGPFAAGHRRGLRRRQGAAGPERVAALNWDDLAAHQGRVYRTCLDRGSPAGRRATRRATGGRGGAGEATGDAARGGRRRGGRPYPEDAADPITDRPSAGPDRDGVRAPSDNVRHPLAVGDRAPGDDPHRWWACSPARARQPRRGGGGRRFRAVDLRRAPPGRRLRDRGPGVDGVGKGDTVGVCLPAFADRPSPR